MICHVGCVKAATGEDISAEALGGAEVHCKISGVADHLADNDAHALQLARRAVSRLNWRRKGQLALRESRPPRLDPQELYGIVGTDLKKPYDVREVIGPVVEAGVPGIGHRVRGPYFNFHHSPADTFDKIDPEHLARNVAAVAALVYALAEERTPLELINLRARAIGTTDKPRMRSEERDGPDPWQAQKNAGGQRCDSGNQGDPGIALHASLPLE